MLLEQRAVSSDAICVWSVEHRVSSYSTLLKITCMYDPEYEDTVLKALLKITCMYNPMPLGQYVILNDAVRTLIRSLVCDLILELENGSESVGKLFRATA